MLRVVSYGGFALIGLLLWSLTAQALEVEDIGLTSGSIEVVSAEELDETRGRFFGFYFAINFVGYWDTVGALPSAMLTFKVGSDRSNMGGVINLIDRRKGSEALSKGGSSHGDRGGALTAHTSTPEGDIQDKVSGPSGQVSEDEGSDREPVVRTSAVVGGGVGGGTKGILQLTQVPGSKNFVYSGIVFNLLVVNVRDSANADNLRNVLQSLIGGPL